MGIIIIQTGKIAMTIFLVFLLAILASAHGYRKPFTAFNDYQAELVHRNRYFGIKAITPVVSYSTYTNYNSQNNQRNAFSLGGRNFVQGRFLPSRFSSTNPVNNLPTGDIIADTRTLSGKVRATLKTLAADQTSAVIINRIINDKDNICLKDLDEGIAGIETATKLLEGAGDDIKTLIKKVESIKSLTDPATVVRSVADILRLVEPVVNKIAPESPVICTASPDEAFGSLRSLATLVDELAYTTKLGLSVEGRRQLKDSASTISAVTTFLTQLRSTFSTFEEICTEDSEYNIKAIGAVGDLIVNLADLFGTLGGVEQGEQIRKGKEFVNKLVAQLNKIDDLGFGTTDCTRPGDFSVAASTIEDLATIIDEADISKLQKELGINLSFVFSA